MICLMGKCPNVKPDPGAFRLLLPPSRPFFLSSWASWRSITAEGQPCSCNIGAGDRPETVSSHLALFVAKVP